MPVKLYMDHHVPKAITIGLRLRSVDVLTAYDDKSHELSDSALLDRAQDLGRVLFSQDDDLLAEATKRLKEGIAFRGVIYGHQTRIAIGSCVRDLELLSKAGNPEDFTNRVFFLPLR